MEPLEIARGGVIEEVKALGIEVQLGETNRLLVGVIDMARVVALPEQLPRMRVLAALAWAGSAHWKRKTRSASEPRKRMDASFRAPAKELAHVPIHGSRE